MESRSEEGGTEKGGPQAETEEGPQEGQRERHGEAERLKPAEAQSEQRDPSVSPELSPSDSGRWWEPGLPGPPLQKPQIPSTPVASWRFVDIA